MFWLMYYCCFILLLYFYLISISFYLLLFCLFFDTKIFMLKVNSIKLLFSINSTSKVNLACSRHSDRGDNAKRCEQEKNKQRGGGVGVRAKELSLPLFSMASTPGQNVHLVVPHNHVVVSSSHLASSSSQLVVSSSLSQSVVELSRRVVMSSRRVVESSRRVVESSRRVVFFDLLSRCTITRLFFNSSYYLSTRHVAFQLVMSPFNSSCNDLVHCC